MKKLLLLITGLLLLFSVEGQILRYSNYTAPAEPPSGEITDDFESYSTGNISGQGNWLSGGRTMNVYDNSGNNVVTGGSYLNTGYAMRTETFADDQYAEIEIVNVTASIGVSVRLNDPGTSTLNGYSYVAASPTRRWVIRTIDGSGTAIADNTSVTNSPGDVLRIEVEGTTIRLYINGSLDTAMGGDGILEDDNIASGAPGVCGYSTANTGLGDNFKCGEL